MAGNYSFLGRDTLLNAKVTDFLAQETTYILYEENVPTTTSGSLATQAGVEILRGNFSGENLFVSKVGVDGNPTQEDVLDSLGVAVAANFVPADTPPAWQLSSTPVTNYALLFAVRGDRDTLTQYLKDNPNYKIAEEVDGPDKVTSVDGQTGDVFLNYSTLQKEVDFASFPATGDEDTLYIDLEKNDLYQWDGSSYVPVSNTPEYTNTLFVGKHGSDTNTGTHPDNPLLTFHEAFNRVNTVIQAPTAVYCFDSGVYNEGTNSLIFDYSMYIHAPSASINASWRATRRNGLTIVIDAMKLLRSRDNDQMFENREPNVYIRAQIIDGSGLGSPKTGQQVFSNSLEGILHVYCNKMFIPTDTTGFSDDGGGNGHTHIEIEDLYLVGDNAVGIEVANSCRIVARIGHILEFASSNATIGVKVTGDDTPEAKLWLSSEEIEADIAISVENDSSNLHVRVGEIRGEIELQGDGSNVLGATLNLDSLVLEGDINIDNGSVLHANIQKHTGAVNITSGTVLGKIGSQHYGEIDFSDPSFILSSIPTYADDAAAGTGGLAAGRVYKTTTGELRIKL